MSGSLDTGFLLAVLDADTEPLVALLDEDDSNQVVYVNVPKLLPAYSL